jgi:nitrite reductase/ring-hydroxylating ferredoxin subunit
MNNERVTVGWIPIATLDRPIPRHGMAIEVEGECIALFAVKGCLYATSNVCTHQFALLTEGYVDGEYIECPMHQGRFHIPTGAPQGPPVTEPLRTYPVRVEGNAVLIELSPADRA